MYIDIQIKYHLFLSDFNKTLMYAFFWVIPRRLNFICRRFGIHSLFHLHRQVGGCRILHTPTCQWRWNIQYSETSAYKIQTPGNHQNKRIQYSGHGESLKLTKLDHAW